MLPIKTTAKLCVFLVLCILAFTSCANPFKKHQSVEVDFNDIKDVQLTYNQNVYNVMLQFSRSVLDIRFQKNNTAFDGVSYKVTPQNCEVNYLGLIHSFKTEALPDSFLPNILWQFFVEVGSCFSTENYDAQEGCYYLTRAINDAFIRFEVYSNQGNVSYALIIT